MLLLLPVRRALLLCCVRGCRVVELCCNAVELVLCFAVLFCIVFADCFLLCGLMRLAFCIGAAVRDEQWSALVGAVRYAVLRGAMLCTVLRGAHCRAVLCYDVQLSAVPSGAAVTVH
jgi:hypothetical protein